MYSISTWNYLKRFGSGANLENALETIKGQGFGVEFWLDWTTDRSFFRPANWQTIKDLCHGIPKFSAHSKLNKTFSKELLLEELDFCASVGADPLVCHPHAIGLKTGTWDIASGLTLTSDNKNFINTILLEAAARSVRIALENGPLDILLQVMHTIEDHPASKFLGICIDTGHANMHSNEIDSPVAKIIQQLKNHIIHLHIHDNKGALDDHQIPGEGITPWQAVFKELDAFEYDGEFVFELNADDPTAAAEKARDFVEKHYKKQHTAS